MNNASEIIFYPSVIFLQYSFILNLDYEQSCYGFYTLFLLNKVKFQLYTLLNAV